MPDESTSRPLHTPCPLFSVEREVSVVDLELNQCVQMSSFFLKNRLPMRLFIQSKKFLATMVLQKHIPHYFATRQ